MLQQSSSARDRQLSDWYERIRTGQLKLPRFQRFEAWDRGRIAGFLNTVIQNLPVGVTLLLDVGDAEKFVSRYVETAPQPGAKVTEHLLDGQQRLTAFWRSVHNNYDGEKYFVYLPAFDPRDEGNHEADDICVKHESHWVHNGVARPVWAGSPRGCLERGRVPLDLLRPEDIGAEINKWIDGATKHLEPADDAPDALVQFKALTRRRDQLRETINVLRERVAHFNLPFLALPASTDADVALQVFVNMNTNSKPLSMYDLTVAKVEGETGASLHDKQEHLEDAYPDVNHYGDLSWPILQTAALMQGLVPNRSGVAAIKYRQLVDDWARLEGAVARTADFLARQHVYDEARLPTNVVLPVVAACLSRVPVDGDAAGRAERLLRAYAWSAFFTTRYEGAANTRALQDYKKLAELLNDSASTGADYGAVPVMDRTEYALPNYEQLMRVGWPKGSDRMARAVLATTLYFAGWDFADGQAASYATLQKREYHHVFPDALLQDAEIESYLALNCALITWKTNRNIGRKDPLEYVRDRVQWSDEAEVGQRFQTHLLDFKELAAAHYVGTDGQPLKGAALTQKLKPDFECFLEHRAKRVAYAAAKLAQGDIPTLGATFASTNAPSGEDSTESTAATA